MTDAETYPRPFSCVATVSYSRTQTHSVSRCMSSPCHLRPVPFQHNTPQCKPGFGPASSRSRRPGTLLWSRRVHTRPVPATPSIFSSVSPFAAEIPMAWFAPCQKPSRDAECSAVRSSHIETLNSGTARLVHETGHFQKTEASMAHEGKEVRQAYDGPNVEHDALIDHLDARIREEHARSSDGSESAAKVSEFCDETGVNSQAYSWMKTILKKLPKKDGQSKAMDIIRSLEIMVPMVKNHVGGQQDEMDLEPEDEPESPPEEAPETDVPEEVAEFNEQVDNVVKPFEANG